MDDKVYSYVGAVIAGIIGLLVAVRLEGTLEVYWMLLLNFGILGGFIFGLLCKNVGGGLFGGILGGIFGMTLTSIYWAFVEDPTMGFFGGILGGLIGGFVGGFVEGNDEDLSIIGRFTSGVLLGALFMSVGFIFGLIVMIIAWIMKDTTIPCTYVDKIPIFIIPIFAAIGLKGGLFFEDLSRAIQYQAEQKERERKKAVEKRRRREAEEMMQREKIKQNILDKIDEVVRKDR